MLIPVFRTCIGKVVFWPQTNQEAHTQTGHIQHLRVKEHTLTPRNIDANHNATQDNVEQVTDFHGSQSGTQKSLGGTAGFLVSTNGRQHAVVKLASSQAGHPTFKICRNKFDKPCSKCDATQWKYWRNKWHTAKQQAGGHQTQPTKPSKPGSLNGHQNTDGRTLNSNNLKTTNFEIAWLGWLTS